MSIDGNSKFKNQYAFALGIGHYQMSAVGRVVTMENVGKRNENQDYACPRWELLSYCRLPIE